MITTVKRFLYFFSFISLGLSSCSRGQNYICVISFKTIQINLSEYKFPRDSLFVAGDLAIEKVIGVQDLEIEGTHSQREEISGYNLIDFKTRKFKFFKKPEDYHSEKETFLPLDSKHIGVEFDFNFYNGETTISSDTTIAGEDCKKVAYVIKDGPMKNGKVTILLKKKRAEGLPILFSNLENKFNGQLIGMTLILPDDNSAQQWEIKCYPASTNSHFNLLKSLKYKR